jgi:hypothetical protein
LVLTINGGAARRRAPSPSPRRLAGERGSQSLELALAIPFVVLGLSVVLHAALFAADLVAAQNVALQAARVAAVDDDAAVNTAVTQAAGRRPVDVELDPASPHRGAGDLVVATVKLRSRAFTPWGVTVWVPATATVRVERP